MIRIIITIHYRCNYKKITSNYSSSGEVEEERQLVLLFAAWRLLLLNILWGKTAWVAIKSETSMKKNKHTNFLGVWEKLFFFLVADGRSAIITPSNIWNLLPHYTFQILVPIAIELIGLDASSTKLYTTRLVYRAFKILKPAWIHNKSKKKVRRLQQRNKEVQRYYFAETQEGLL